MRRLIFLRSARKDISDIYKFITTESASRSRGREFTTRIVQKCSHLSKLPGQIGQLRPELGDGLRSFVVQGYVIILRYTDTSLQVIRILEGHRDISTEFAR